MLSSFVSFQISLETSKGSAIPFSSGSALPYIFARYSWDSQFLSLLHESSLKDIVHIGPKGLLYPRFRVMICCSSPPPTCLSQRDALYEAGTILFFVFVLNIFY